MNTLEYATPGDDLRSFSPWRVFNWAMFLGMSWTWCIGLFLPVLLIRDYNTIAWIIFAVTNVVGATTMGWVLSKSASRSIVDKHRGALRVFSIVTISFQLFFLVFVRSQVLRGGNDVVYVAILALALFIILLSTNRLATTGAICVFIASVVIGLRWLSMPTVRETLHTLHRDMLSPSAMDAPIRAWGPGLAAVCLFGFGLCPYLDITFHRARQNLSDRESRFAFTTGFGVFFFAMICLSLCYSMAIIFFWGASVRAFGEESVFLLRLLWAIQLPYTIAVHLRDPIWRGREVRWMASASALLFLATIVAMALLASLYPQSGELIYRCFISFYGLVTPAYVWLCLLPDRGRRSPSKRALTITFATIAIAYPFYWLAFIDGRMSDVLIGVALVLLARLLVRPIQQNSAPTS